MNPIVKWLESPDGEEWSRKAHMRVKHHAIIEDWPALPDGHHPGVTFLGFDGEGYQEAGTCRCLSDTKTFYATKGMWSCSPEIQPPADWCDVPYNPDLRF